MTALGGESDRDFKLRCAISSLGLAGDRPVMDLMAKLHAVAAPDLPYWGYDRHGCWYIQWGGEATKDGNRRLSITLSPHLPAIY